MFGITGEDVDNVACVEMTKEFAELCDELSTAFESSESHDDILTALPGDEEDGCKAVRLGLLIGFQITLQMVVGENAGAVN